MRRRAGVFPLKDLQDYTKAYEALSTNPALRYGYDDRLMDFPGDTSNWVRKIYGAWETHIIHCGTRLILYALESKVCPTSDAKAFGRVAKLLTKSQRAPNKPYAWWVQYKDDLSCLLNLERWKDKSEEEGTGLIETVSGFKLINEAPKLSAKDYELVKTDFTKAVRLIEGSGVIHASNLSYGNCIIVPEIEKASVLAFYRIKDDSLYLKSKTKDRASLIQTIIHEIGHRLWFRFLDEQQRKSWKAWHQQCLSARAEITMPAVGDVFTIPVRGYGTNPIVTKVFADRYYLNGEEVKFFPGKVIREYLKTLANFPSNYASVSAEENFSESFAFYCMGTLKDTHRDNFKTLFGR